MHMMQYSIQHGGGQCCVTGEGLVPLAKGQVRGQDNGTPFAAFGDELEQQIRLIPRHWQV